MRATALIVACFALAAPPAFAQGAAGANPRILNGRLDTQAAGANLQATFQRLVAAQTEPAWIGYSVPTMSDANRRLCCNGDTWISDGVIISNGRLATCG